MVAEVTPSEDRYVHGHHESVLRSHTWRTVENSAAYLVAHLRPGLDVLDVGCGPGTISLDLAQRVGPGTVTGIDVSDEVIAKAEAHRAEVGVDNCSFRVDDVYALTADDDSVDITHAHQVLQHLPDPVAALAEMRRVTRPGGIVAARDADYGAFVWAPADDALDHWLDVYHRITRANSVEADAGRHLPRWFREAGFEDVTVTASAWVFASPDERRWWGSLWADRVRQSTFATEALDHGFADDHDLHRIADAFQRWADTPDATFIVPHGEVVGIA